MPDQIMQIGISSLLLTKYDPALVFMFFYFNAMRATFVWHSKYKIVDESLSLDTDM
ncbi:hypothetical protein TUM4637_36580 [Shewanella hafniensis]|nr:hypothetical protein TUM4637_36580 [Shewanella hafniensis]